MKIHVKKFCNWSHSMQKKLQYATFGELDGLMYMTSSNNPKTLTYVAINNTHIMGWLMLGKTRLNPAAMIFTNKRYRNRGVGKALVNKVCSHEKRTIHVFPHDDASDVFWYKMSKMHNNITPITENNFHKMSKKINAPTSLFMQWSSI